jgi:transcriptional regulator with GAF, ATPase, and Fis domain
VAGVASGTVFFQDMPYRGSLIEHNVNLIEASGEPILFKFSQDFTQFTDKNIITNLKNFGQQQAIVTTLTVGPLLLGIISLDSYKADRYSREQFPILQSIAADIALAIKNILDQAQTGGTSALP